jgi:hypothetical protein
MVSGISFDAGEAARERLPIPLPLCVGESGTSYPYHLPNWARRNDNAEDCGKGD